MDAAKKDTVLSQLPPPEQIRERLGQKKREVALLKQLLKLTEKAAKDGREVGNV